MTRAVFLWSSLVAHVLGSCECPDRLPADLVRSACRSLADPPAFVRRLARVRLDSPKFQGDFLGVLIARANPIAVRLQLFPDFGGKVMDVTATAKEQFGSIPATGQTLDYPNNPDGDRLLQMFASSLLEAHGWLPEDRITCGRHAEGGGIRLDLSPRFGASSVVLELNRDATVRTFDITRRGVSWRMRVLGDGLERERIEITAKDFALVATVEESEVLTAISETLFARPR